MNPVDVIRRKRGREILSREELEFFVGGYVAGRVPDYQMSAFLMAVCFAGMNFEETATLTDVMLHSGVVVDLREVSGVKVDKHSTGGVGDKVSLILAPMVAACGVPVPMISGRGLGHTGGTLDKLESIPGFRTDLSLKEYREVIKKTGAVMIGQTKEIVPADKTMYALRDSTATVECIPLIAGSIMSKKLAEGIDALVLDVKTGRGAFMQTEERAMELARMLIAIGEQFGKRTVAFLTDMNQPLGYAVGNWLEVVECVDCLKGKEVPDLMELTYILGGAMVMLGGKAKTVRDGVEQCTKVLRSGKAYEKFLEMVRSQGGDVAMLDKPDRYPRCAYAQSVTSNQAGSVESIDALEIGLVSNLLGAGRTNMNEAIDPKAGVVLRKKVGDEVTAGEIVAELFTNRQEVVSTAANRLEKAFTVATVRPVKRPLIRMIIDKEGQHAWKRSDQ